MCVVGDLGKWTKEAREAVKGYGWEDFCSSIFCATFKTGHWLAKPFSQAENISWLFFPNPSLLREALRGNEYEDNKKGERQKKEWEGKDGAGKWER